MQLTIEQMNRILADLQYLFESDENLVAIDIEHDENGENPKILLQHLKPDLFQQAQKSNSLGRTYILDSIVNNETIELPIELVKSDPITLELAQPDEKSIFDDLIDTTSLVGLAGTKISRENGSWGTLCLSGINIKIEFDGKICSVEDSFIITNSHVARKLGNKLFSFGKQIGTVSCLFDLNDKRACDIGLAPWTSDLVKKNLFKVYNPSGSPNTINKLQTVANNARIHKQGAKTGLTKGVVKGKTVTRVEGYTGLFPAWKGTYKSDGGDSGSPILMQGENGEWFHSGIHFSSGPRFQSWDDVILATGV